MKIKPEHYQHMLEAIRPLAPRLAEHREKLKGDPRVKDIEKRVRWDAFNAAGLTRWSCDTLYPYLNDDHIDTALRTIMKEITCPRC